MAETRKVLGQLNPSAATLTDLYVVPGSTEAIVSTLTVVNRSSTATSFRVSVAIAGAANADKQYIYYDLPIGGNDSFAATLGLTLAATDKVRVYATLATLSFNLFGIQLT